MVVLTVTERDLPLLQFFTALPVKLQAMVTGSTDVISEDVAHVVQHCFKVIPAVEGQKAKLGYKRQWALFHTEEQICEI